MSWLLVAISAYLLLAVANLFDKFLVDNVIKDSRAYAFAACLLSAILILAAPWLLDWPGVWLLLFNLFNGAIFAVALTLLYESLKRGEASRVLVFIGGSTPVFSLVLSALFFKETFSYTQLAGIALSLLGVFLIAFLPEGRGFMQRIAVKFKIDLSKKGKNSLVIALGSALAYSLYFVGTKSAYAEQSFASAFIWTRVGSAIFVLFFLLSPSTRRSIIKFFSRSDGGKNKVLVAANQIVGSAGFILQNYAVFLGSVVLVNALQGIQYAFLLILSAILAALAPKLLKEKFSWRIMAWKAGAIFLIGIGFYFLTI